MARTGSAQRILLLRTDRLGETVLSLPVADALKQHDPPAVVAALVRPELAPLVERYASIDRVLTYRPGPRSLWWLRALRLARRLRREAFTTAIVLNPMKELHVAVRLAGIPRRVGYGRKWGGLLTDRVADRKALGAQHELQYNLDVLRVLGIPAQVRPGGFSSLEPERSRVAQRLTEQGINPDAPFVVVHPGTSNPTKRWPPERFRRVIEYTVASLRVPVVVVGGAEERDLARAALPDGLSVVNFTGELTLVELAALLERARLLLSNDSGPVHLAACVGTRVVALFGTDDPGSQPARWGPLGEGHTVLHKRLTALSVEEVIAAIRGTLP